jgi:5-methyltetrahydropteroyltriglutamate--homocysteine methyltransferase
LSELKNIRTDVVGSLLRPAAWKEAKLRHEIGALDDAGLAEVELQCLREHVQLQESAGLDVVSDGELSRLNFQDSFGLSVSGYDAVVDRFNANLQRAAGGTALSRWDLPDLTLPGTPVVHRRPTASRLKLERNVPLEEYRRVAPLASKPVKVALIGPDRIAQRFEHERSKSVYRNTDEFVADVVAIQRKMIKQLVDAGCRYVHIDAPGYTAYVDERSLAAMRARGENPMENFARSLRADAELVKGFPGVTFGIHLCRGNQRSMWHREGAYDAIAERLFGELPHDRFLLEYDSPRAGGFQPLRHVRKDAVVVLGLVSTKVVALESVDELRRRVDAAAKVVPLERLAISPQCGFASDVVGNLIEEDDQRRKLERVVEAARKIWG